MNTFTAFQKEVIDKIIERKISDIYSFLEVMRLCTVRNYGWSEHKRAISSENVHECNYLYELNETTFDELKIQISEFISVCNFIERESYIYAFPIKTRIFKPIVMFKSDTEIDNSETFNFYSINQLIFSRSLYEFFPSPELETFKKRNYRTIQQIILIQEIKDRKRAQLLTLFVALLSIVVGLMSIIVDITYSGKERDVNIKNENAFKDTIIVKYVNEKKYLDTNKQLRDSLKK